MHNWKSVAFVTAVSLALCGGARAETLVVGADSSNPPWEYKDKAGNYIGFEIDLVNEIGRRLGMDVKIEDYGFPALFPGVSSGRIQAAISSITITNERLKNASFTQGFYDSDLALVSRENSEIKSLADTSGKAMGAVSATVGEKWIKGNTQKYAFGDYRGYNTQDPLLLDLKAGRIDAAVGDISGIQFAIKAIKGLKVDEQIPTGDKFGIMMPKNSPLLSKVNDVMTEMKKEGFIADLHKKWFGVAPDKSSSTVQERPLPVLQ
ncbi:amino acid ABC transporter substrate-binding protein [Ensifer sp. ENS05]|uniref:ABC transporter substrate-binding protein n=1 Tax=Ensifer sp. ENS05 TaxID=2769277 RepID=UPI00178312D7|nr:ABC transporter substrate-binding protein [Ensifer sp. ENS05]MBD9597394.1 amino acid ABC transporter substrate-binding protein [Ensifer sp. ENS05]